MLLHHEQAGVALSSIVTMLGGGAASLHAIVHYVRLLLRRLHHRPED